MPSLYLYLLKFSIALGCFYLFYQLVLRRLTFYQWNRYYLAAYPLICFLIPFIDITGLLKKQELLQTHLVAIPSVSTLASPQAITEADSRTGFVPGGWNLLFIVFITGVIILLARLLKQYYSLQRIKSTATITCHDQIWLYDVGRTINPFSFGNDIFINRRQHSDDELEKIIQHEFIHVKQKHTVDLIIGELICIFNWFNPFAWLIRTAIRQNLEFIADNAVLASGADARQYQYLLLKVIGVPQYSITNHFSFSSLKKRIAMMNKLRSAKLHLVKFLFLLPLCAVILLAFRNEEIESRKQEKGGKKVPDVVLDVMSRKPIGEVKVKERAGGIASVTYNDGSIHLILAVSKSINVNDTVPPVVIGGETIKDLIKQLPDIQVNSNGNMTVKGEAVKKVFVDGKEFLIKDGSIGAVHLVSDTTPRPPVPPAPVVKSLPEGVKSIRITDNQATVIYKNGNEERFNLTMEKDKAAFDKKFGDYTAPVPPSPVVADPVPPLPPNVEAPLPPPLPSGVESMNIKNNKVTIRLKNGKLETYDLNKGDQKAAYYRRYGSFPKAPEPVTLPPVPSIPAAPPTPPTPPAKADKKETNGVVQVSPGVYMLPKQAMDALLAEAWKRGEIFIGISNPLDIKIDQVRTEDMVIQLEHGNVRFSNGIFYAQPTRQGMTNLIIFKRENDGSKTHLKTLPLNVKRLPDPTLLKKEHKEPVINPAEL
jgi:beta-lactamase regulating signal transducer with metallopeptidase domain